MRPNTCYPSHNHHRRCLLQFLWEHEASRYMIPLTTLEPSPMPALGPGIPDTDQSMPITPPLGRSTARLTRVTPMEEDDDEQQVSPRTVPRHRSTHRRPNRLFLRRPTRHGSTFCGDLDVERLSTPAHMLRSIDGVLDEPTLTQEAMVPTPRASHWSPPTSEEMVFPMEEEHATTTSLLDSSSPTTWDVPAQGQVYEGYTGTEGHADGMSIRSGPILPHLEEPVPSWLSPEPRFSPMTLPSPINVTYPDHLNPYLSGGYVTDSYGNRLIRRVQNLDTTSLPLRRYANDDVGNARSSPKERGRYVEVVNKSADDGEDEYESDDERSS